MRSEVNFLEEMNRTNPNLVLCLSYWSEGEGGLGDDLKFWVSNIILASFDSLHSCLIFITLLVFPLLLGYGGGF